MDMAFWDNLITQIARLLSYFLALFGVKKAEEEEIIPTEPVTEPETTDPSTGG